MTFDVGGSRVHCSTLPGIVLGEGEDPGIEGESRGLGRGQSTGTNIRDVERGREREKGREKL